jgi:hypothetical protein
MKIEGNYYLMRGNWRARLNYMLVRDMKYREIQFDSGVSEECAALWVSLKCIYICFNCLTACLYRRIFNILF